VRKSILYFLIFLLIQILTSGCAGPRKLVTVGQEIIVERSSESKPDWIFSPITIEEGRLLFSGQVLGQADFSLALRHAKADAAKNITEGVQVKVWKEFSNVLREAGIEMDIGEFLPDVLGMIMDNLNIHGLEPKEIYYEKVEKTTVEGVDYFYNCYNLIEISEDDYAKARNLALQKIKESGKIENNRKLEELAELLLKKLSQ